MAEYKLVLPAMGEGVMEATVTGWLKNVGDFVEEDESVVEVATDKVDTEVPSPVSGTIKQIIAQVNDVVQIEQAVAILEVEHEVEGENSPNHSPENESNHINKPEQEVLEEISQPLTQSESTKADAGFLSPLVKSMIETEGISNQELNQIKGTGKGNRITKEDILSYLKNREDSNQSEIVEVVSDVKEENSFKSGNIHTPEIQHSIPNERNSITEHQIQNSPRKTQSVQLKAGDEVIEMDRMRKLISQHMVHSKQTSAHVTSVVECDMTNVVRWRNANKDKFFDLYKEKITFMPIIVQAIVKSIRDFPMINVSVNEDTIIKKRDINVGIATALANGNLIVPVIKNADQLNLSGLARTLNDLIVRARESRLEPHEIKGGTYTLTNIGTFGNVVGTPIINQPQVAIMAVGAIEKKPAVIETPNGDLIGIRHKMYLSHTYDHRVVDGALGGMFVKKVSDYLENFDLETQF